jgi:dTDP-glucose 4,6-dehydratase
MKVLITGIAGFIGANFTKYLLENTDWHIVGIDSFYHKGIYTRLNRTIDYNYFAYNKKFQIYNHDLTTPIDRPLENQIMERQIDEHGCITENPIDVVFDLASDSAVERSITNPEHCWKNNCNVIYNVLEFCRKVKVGKLIHISTDETMGDAEHNNSSHKEWSPTIPTNIYSASKAAQEALCMAYYRTYDMPIVITNCVNVIGEWQDTEKFLPRIIQSVATGKEISIYATKIRDKIIVGSRLYIDVMDKSSALQFIAELPTARFSLGNALLDRYNISSTTLVSNIEVAELVAKIMNKPLKGKIITTEDVRPGYDQCYMLDDSKLRKLGWQQKISFEDTLRRVIKHTLENKEWII